MATVKVVVTALQRYWAAGRCWEAGETEAVLEDLPGLPVEQQLAQLDGAKGGKILEQNGLERSNPEQRSPCALTYRIIEDPPPAPPAAVDAPEDLADPDARPDDPSVPPTPGPTTTTEPPLAS